jgi:hypothetical protein
LVPFKLSDVRIFIEILTLPIIVPTKILTNSKLRKNAANKYHNETKNETFAMQEIFGA